MGGLSLTHILIVLVIALLLFGAGRVSDLGKGLGEGIKNFKKGLRDDEDDAPQKIVVKTKDEAPQQLSTGKKKKVIQVEVDEDADEEEVRQKIAESKKS